MIIQLKEVFVVAKVPAQISIINAFSLQYLDRTPIEHLNLLVYRLCIISCSKLVNDTLSNCYFGRSCGVAIIFVAFRL